MILAREVIIMTDWLSTLACSFWAQASVLAECGGAKHVEEPGNGDVEGDVRKYITAFQCQCCALNGKLIQCGSMVMVVEIWALKHFCASRLTGYQ